MKLAKIYVDGVNIRATLLSSITKGLVGATVDLEITGPEWEGLTKTVVFRGGVTRDVLFAGETVTVPAETVANAGERLRVGVYGTGMENNIVIPTLWCDLGRVMDAADPSGDESTDPALAVWAQIQAKIGDLSKLNTDAKENLVAAINEALTKGGGTVDETAIQEIVERYLEENPPKIDAVLYSSQTLSEEQKAQARDNIGAVSIGEVEELFAGGIDQAVVKHLTENPVEGGMTKTEKDLVLTLLSNVAYVSDGMSEILAQLRGLWSSEGIAYKWVVGYNGTGDSSGVAMLTGPNATRALAAAVNTGVPLYYSSGGVASVASPYSPVVIPEGAVSVTVKCPGFRISFNELKMVDSTWYRQFSSDSAATADEATYAFKSAESSGLYIKLRHLTEDYAELSGVPEAVDITFNY